MQVVILAGGLGTRLRPVTMQVPKPMVPVEGVPFLEHQLRLLARQSFGEILILTGYLGDQIEAYFGNGRRLGLEISYRRESEPLGTGGALRDARHLVADPLLVIYGDSYLPIEYRKVGEKLGETAALGVLAVHRDVSGETDVHPNVALGEDGAVLRYDKNGATRPEELCYIDAGVLALRRAVLDLMPASGALSLEEHTFPLLIAQRRLFGYPTAQRFYDIGTFERLHKIKEYLQ